MGLSSPSPVERVKDLLLCARPWTDLCQAPRPRLPSLEQSPVSKIGIAKRHTHSSDYQPRKGSAGRASLSEKIRAEPRLEDGQAKRERSGQREQHVQELGGKKGGGSRVCSGDERPRGYSHVAGAGAAALREEGRGCVTRLGGRCGLGAMSQI